VNMTLSTNIVTSINIHVPFSLSWIILSVLWFMMVLLLCSYLFHTLFTFFHYSFLLILMHFYTGFMSVILPQISPVCQFAVNSHSTFSPIVKFLCQYCVCWCNVLYFVVKMLSLFSLYTIFVFVMSVFRNILSVTPELFMQLLHLQFDLSHLPATVKW